MFTILVCGSRTWGNYDEVFSKLNSACDKHGLWEGGYKHNEVNRAKCKIIAADTTTVDHWASSWSDAYDASFQRFELDAKDGISAASCRNAAMFAENPDLVLCFGKDSNTEELINRAYRANVAVQQFKQKPSIDF